jgi:hypothetical protein
MSEQPERGPDREAPEPSREPYAPPRLVRHGTIEDVTRGQQGLAAGDMASTVT